jgi:hypothetical protein
VPTDAHQTHLNAKTRAQSTNETFLRDIPSQNRAKNVRETPYAAFVCAFLLALSAPALRVYTALHTTQKQRKKKRKKKAPVKRANERRAKDAMSFTPNNETT